MIATIRLPWMAPPLKSNDRMHWAAKSKETKIIRNATALACVRQLNPHDLPMPLPGPVVVTLIWEVADKRRRDVGACAPTLKAAIDGIVDSGWLRQDDWTVVAEERLRIEVGTRKGVRIEITEAPKP
jgi:Holliday junction resolvase RusA-like endonuclease